MNQILNLDFINHEEQWKNSILEFKIMNQIYVYVKKID